MENVIEIVRSVVNIDSAKERNLKASIIYSNWRKGKVFTDLKVFYFQDAETGEIFNEKGFYCEDEWQLSEDTLCVDMYGRDYITEENPHINWEDPFYSKFLKNIKHD